MSTATDCHTSHEINIHKWQQYIYLFISIKSCIRENELEKEERLSHKR
jgi:hypothetical protein